MSVTSEDTIARIFGKLDDIEEKIGHEIDAIVDAGPTGLEPTSVLDMTGGAVEVIRAGKGDVSALLR